VDNNYLDLSTTKSGFVHTLPSGRLTLESGRRAESHSSLAFFFSTKDATYIKG
jgi:hypothetical protein